MADYLSPEDYGAFESNQKSTLDGELIWWDNLNSVPADDQARIRGVIRDDCAAYGRLGYDVQMTHRGHDNYVAMHIKHADVSLVTHSDKAILKGAASATRIRAGWGGSS